MKVNKSNYTTTLLLGAYFEWTLNSHPVLSLHFAELKTVQLIFKRRKWNEPSTYGTGGGSWAWRSGENFRIQLKPKQSATRYRPRKLQNGIKTTGVS